MTATAWSPLEADNVAHPGVDRPDHISPDDWARMPWSARMRAARTLRVAPAPTPCEVEAPREDTEEVAGEKGKLPATFPAPTLPDPPPVWLIAAHANRPALRGLVSRTNHIRHPHPTAAADRRRRSKASRRGYPIVP